MKTPSPPRTIQIEESNEESSSYGNRSDSTTSSKSHNNSLSTFTPSSARIVQYELAIKNMEKMYKTRIQELEQELRRKVTSKKSTKNRGELVVSKHFEGYVKHIAKSEIFPRVKFISSAKMLDDLKKPNSIGNFFLNKFHEDELKSQLHNNEKMNDKKIWENSKNIVYDMIRQKRRSVQTEIKKAFKGTYHFTFKKQFTRTNAFAQ